ncbi:MAG: hypothetical protein ACK5H2_04320 [Beutenbergiaceae bacterium]
MPDRTGMLAGAADPLGALPGGWIFGIGRDGELEDYAERVIGLSDAELAAWLDARSEQDLADLVNAMDGSDRTRLLSFLAANAPTLMLPKLISAIPELNPSPGAGVGWGFPGGSSSLYSTDPDHQWIGDANQNDVGDCWFLSTLAGVVQNDSSWVSEHVVPNDNGTVTVYLYDDDGNRVPVTVPRSYLPMTDRTCTGRVTCVATWTVL